METLMGKEKGVRETGRSLSEGSWCRGPRFCGAGMGRVNRSRERREGKGMSCPSKCFHIAGPPGCQQAEILAGLKRGAANMLQYSPISNIGLRSGYFSRLAH